MADTPNPQPSPRAVRWRSANRPHQFHYRSHPFANTSRNSFPELDEVFTNNVDAIKKAPTTPKLRKPKFETNDPGPGPNTSTILSTPERDGSICSSTALLNDISVDMSIGARAALAEHRRHVSRFGIDGTTSKNPTERTFNHADEQWNRVLDGNCSQASWSTYTGDQESNMSLTGRFSVAPNLNVSTTLADGEANTNTSDFFNINNSKIQNLMTPEKNKPKVDEASRLARLGEGEATHRRAAYENEYAESLGASTAATTESGMARLFAAAMGLNDGEEKGSNSDSFSATDVSRWSIGNSVQGQKWSDESSDERNKKEHTRSPSSTCLFHADEVSDIGDLIPPIDINPSRHFKASQDSCATPRRSPQSAAKEHCNLGLLGLSPIASQAGSQTAKDRPISHIGTGNPSISFSAVFESPCKRRASPMGRGPNDFPLEGYRDIAPSPITNLDASNFSSSLADIPQNSPVTEQLQWDGNLFSDDKISSIYPEIRMGSVSLQSTKDKQHADYKVFDHNATVSSLRHEHQTYTISPQDNGEFRFRHRGTEGSFSTPPNEIGTTASSTVDLSPVRKSYLKSASRSLLESFESDCQLSTANT